MSGLEPHELLGLLRAGVSERTDGESVEEVFERLWGQSYRAVAELSLHTGHPATFVMGVELGLRLRDALRDLEAIQEVTPDG